MSEWHNTSKTRALTAEDIKKFRELHRILSEKTGIEDAQKRALGAQMMVDLPRILDEIDALRAEVERLTEEINTLHGVLLDRCEVGMDDGFATAATLSQWLESAIEKYDEISVGMTDEMKLQALAFIEKDLRAAELQGGADE